jgi:uncharacterized membrane protein YkvA (DUF1232 family)
MGTELTVALVIAAVAGVAMLGATIILFIKVVRARAVLRDAGVPLKNKVAFWAALCYVISPVDLLPDPIYLDDIGVLLLTLRALHAAATTAAGPRGIQTTAK